MKGLRFRLTAYLQTSCLLLSTPILSAQTFDLIDKEIVQAGETVTISGTGIEPTSTYEILLNDLTIAANPVDTETLTFVVPSNAVPGAIRITIDSGPEIPTLFSIEPVREIAISFSATIPIDTSTFIIGSIFGDSLDSGPTYRTLITNGEPTLVAGNDGPTSPDFMGIALNESSTMELSPRSTATAMMFAVPSIFTFDPVLAQARLDAIDSLPELDTAEQAIINSLAATSSYLENPSVQAALQALFIAAVDTILVPPDPPPAAYSGGIQQMEGNVSTDGFKEDVNNQSLDFTVDPHQLSDVEWAHLESITTTKVAKPFTNDSGIPHRAISIDNGSITSFFQGHPLDHLVEVYQLDPTSFTSLQEIANLQGSLTEVYPRYYTLAIDRRTIPGAIKFQIAGQEATYSRLKEALGFKSFENEVLNFERENELYIPSDRPGVYMARAFNGSLFPPQDLLISSLPYGSVSDRVMFLENFGIAIWEAVMVYIKLTDMRKSKMEANKESKPSKYFEESDVRGVTKAIALELLRKAAEDRLSWNGLKQTFKKAVSKTLEAFIENSIKVRLEAAEFNAIKDNLDSWTGAIDLITEDAPQAFARFFWLFNASRLVGLGPVTKSVESSIFVIGDPFAPKITRLSSLYGPRGSQLVILGRNFTDNPDDILVRFGPVPDDPENPASEGPIANVLKSSWSFIGIEVPDLPNPEGPSIITEISVTIKGTGSDTSDNLPDNRDRFTVIPDPIIESINPATPQANGLMIVNGQNFSPDYTKNKVVTDFNELNVLSGTDTQLLVRVPNTDATLSIRVEVQGRQGNAFEFTPEVPFPVPGGGEFGWVIPVTTTSMGNTPDGDITLEEAMLMARGGFSGTGLARDINRRPEGYTGSDTFESDHLGGYNDLTTEPGITTADYVVLSASLNGGVIYVNTPLPAMANYDTIRTEYGAEVLIHGDPGSTDGIVIGNALDVTVRSLDIEGFPGSGVRITGTSSNIVVEDVTVADCGTGMLIEGTASDLFLKEMTFTNSTNHGIHFNGGGANEISDTLLDYFIIDTAGGHGLYLAGNVHDCQISVFNITNPGTGTGMDGIRLAGPDVKFNSLDRSTDTYQDGYLPAFDLAAIGVSGFGGYGIHVDGGASNNVLDPGNITNNTTGGILVEGATTSGNSFGGNSGLFFQSHITLSGNGGPGITVSAPGTILRKYNIFNNGLPDTDGNHGIWLDGPDATEIEIDGMRIGWDDGFAPTNFDYTNHGSGIAITGGANDILIGTYVEQPGGLDRNFITGNRDHGILIDGAGTSKVVINHTDIGRANSDLSIGFDNYNRQAGLIPFANGLNGIQIQNGATNIEIGSEEITRDVHIVNHATSTGVYIAGPDAGLVRIFGTHFGTGWFAEDEGNKIGIHMANGTQGNIIGMRGQPLIGEFPYDITTKFFHNTFAAHSEAAIIIEDSGGTFPGPIPDEPPETPPEGANVVLNNYFGWPWEIDNYSDTPPGNKVDILIKGNSFANRIGGIHWTESNDFTFADRAGIELQGVSPPANWMSNRIIGNWFWYMGDKLVSPPTDIINVAQPVGVGILLTSGSSGNIIGGLGEGETNYIDGGLVGVWIEGLLNPGATQNQIVQCNIRYNTWAGVLSRHAHGNRYGPYLEVWRNGTLSSGLGGIILDNSDNNTIYGNWIGTSRYEPTSTGLRNYNQGIHLINSGYNQVGGPGRLSNVIVNNNHNGILLEGVGSTRNRINNNAIGLLPNNNRIVRGNLQAGIRLKGGAWRNLVGGTTTGIDSRGKSWRQDLPNDITGGASGILSEDSGTTENQYRRNRISGNSGPGIQDFSGNATDVPSPIILSAGEDMVSGTVDSTRIPDGSIVEIFSDTGDEGGEFIGSAIVQNGTFAVSPLGIMGPNINATVTHGVTGVTSEFSTLTPTSILQTMALSRYNNIPPMIRDEANTGRILLGKYQFTGTGRDASIDRVVFSATGTANESTAADTYQVLHDADNSGDLSVGDVVLAEGMTMSSDNGTLLTYPRLKVPAGQPQTLLLAANMNGSAAKDQTMIFNILNAARVLTVGLPIPFEVLEDGAFPITSDTVILYEGMAPDLGFGTYMSDAFPAETDPAIIGPDADPDGDGRSNLREYAEGTDPSVADSPPPTTIERVGETLVVSFRERAGASDLIRDILFSRQLTDWARDNSRILSLDITDAGGGMNQVDVVIDISDIIIDNIFVQLDYSQAP